MKTGADAEGERHAVDEMLPHGFMTLEGPVDDGDGGIVFSDVYGGGIHHLDKDGALSVLVPKRRGAGGICPHAEGGYVVTGRDVSHVKDGQTRILFAREDLPSTAADRVSGFNDILCARDGSILVGAVRQDEAGERAPGDLVRITAEHQGSIVYAGVSLPNGLGISPDGTRLYHCDTYNNRILVSRMEENRPAIRTEWPWTRPGICGSRSTTAAASPNTVPTGANSAASNCRSATSSASASAGATAPNSSW
jgi:gluconolactonase